MEDNPESKIERATSVQFNAETWSAFARLAVTLIVSVATVFGWTLDANLILNILLSAGAICLMVRALWWKNNNVTEAAQEAQLLLDEIKQRDKKPDATVGGTD